MVKNAFGDRDLQTKYSVLISYVVLKNFQDFSRHSHYFLFSRTFSGLETNFFTFQVFQGAWEPCETMYLTEAFMKINGIICNEFANLRNAQVSEKLSQY